VLSGRPAGTVPCRDGDAVRTPSASERRGARIRYGSRCLSFSPAVRSFSAPFTGPYPKGAQVARVTCIPLRFGGGRAGGCAEPAPAAPLERVSTLSFFGSSSLLRRVFLLLFLLFCCVFSSSGFHFFAYFLSARACPVASWIPRR
jgi:hypothetical protein